MRVVQVPAKTTHDLRRRILREGRSDAEVCFAGDDADDTLHLAVIDHRGKPVAVATSSAAPCHLRAGRRAWRIRGMAVEPDHRGEGLGSQLLHEVEARATAAGVEVLWAEARDTALHFYRSRGWSVHGNGYTTPATGLPHHTVIRDLVGSA